LYGASIVEIVVELLFADVDGSFLYRKQQTLLSRVPPPGPPLAGWELVTDSNVDSLAVSIPTVTSGKKLHIHKII